MADGLGVQALHRPSPKYSASHLDTCVGLAASQRVLVNSPANCANSYSGKILQNTMTPSFIFLQRAMVLERVEKIRPQSKVQAEWSDVIQKAFGGTYRAVHNTEDRKTRRRVLCGRDHKKRGNEQKEQLNPCFLQ